MSRQFYVSISVVSTFVSVRVSQVVSCSSQNYLIALWGTEKNALTPTCFFAQILKIDV